MSELTESFVRANGRQPTVEERDAIFAQFLTVEEGEEGDEGDEGENDGDDDDEDDGGI
jgi:hypothetical protein